MFDWLASSLSRVPSALIVPNTWRWAGRMPATPSSVAPRAASSDLNRRTTFPASCPTGNRSLSVVDIASQE